MSMVLIQQVDFSSFVLFNLDCGYTQKSYFSEKVLIMVTPTSSLNVSTFTLMKRLEDVMFPGLFLWTSSLEPWTQSGLVHLDNYFVLTILCLVKPVSNISSRF